MSERDDDQRRLDASVELIQRLLGRAREMQHVKALPQLAAEVLAEQLGDIRLVVDG